MCYIQGWNKNKNKNGIQITKAPLCVDLLVYYVNKVKKDNESIGPLINLEPKNGILKKVAQLETEQFMLMN